MAIRIDGLSDDEQFTVDALFKQLEDKQARNGMRAAYYDGKNATLDIGKSLPPTFRNLATVLGWPAKAVDTLSHRCHLEGFVVPGLDIDDLGVTEIWDANNLTIEAPQAGLSSLIHSVAWVITTLGVDDEPDVVITTRDALTGTGLWSTRRRTLEAFLSVIDTDDRGKPSEVVIYWPGENVFASNLSGRWMVEDRRTHNLGRVPVEPLVFKPRIGRPFGSSRISRAVMSMTDLAMRTVIRSEVSAELYSVPQRVVLGADENMFKDAAGNPLPAWQVVFGRVWGVSRDENGEMPSIQQLQQASQQPHMDQLRSLAQLFAGETSIPIASLGISTDANPASAEAYHASREDLISLAEATCDGWEPAWRRTMLTAIELRDGLDGVPAELQRMRAKFRSPALTSRASAADATLKMIQAFPWMADSDTALELYGFDQVTLDRLLADKRKGQARGTIAALASLTNGAG